MDVISRLASFNGFVITRIETVEQYETLLSVMDVSRICVDPNQLDEVLLFTYYRDGEFIAASCNNAHAFYGVGNVELHQLDWVDRDLICQLRACRNYVESLFKKRT